MLRYRFRRHGLDAGTGGRTGRRDHELLDHGVQDTGPDGAGWALAIRGVDTDGLDLALAWTIRGAPHAYRRADLAGVAAATAPFSEADAAKRVFDAAKPLRAAGVPILDALRTVATHLRDIARSPVTKGEASTRLTERLDPPYLRRCRPCGATHAYEMPFRLAALHAGLALEPATSPPVLRRVARLRAPGYRTLAGDAEPRLDVIRGYLRFFGPARVGDVAAYLDAPVAEVKAHWPDDAVEVEVRDDPVSGRREPRVALADDRAALEEAPADDAGGVVRLVGPYDPYLQLRDRELLVSDAGRRKELWPVLGRPGAIVDGHGEIAGTWRPRSSGRSLTVRIDPWSRLSAKTRRLVEDQAARLADHRGVTLAGVVED